MGAKFDTEPPSSAPGNTRLWRYALSVYAKPGVADEMLRLQDEDGADVLWLLTALWLAEEGIALSEALVVQPEYEQWRETMILPIRNQRRACDRVDTPELYELLKKAELEAEREGLKRLYFVLHGAEKEPEASAEQNLACVVRDKGRCGLLIEKIKGLGV